MLFRILILVIQFKKTGYNTNVAEIENKILGRDQDNYINTQEFNKLMANNFAARLAQAKLATKANIADVKKETDFDKQIKNSSKSIIQTRTR